MSIENVESPYWANMFGEPPIMMKDTEEYEYVNYYDDSTAGETVEATRPDFTLFNRDIDSYLLWYKGVISMKGRIRENDGTETAQTNMALSNMGHIGYWDKAELSINDIPVEQNLNPYKVCLIKALTRFSDDNARSQGSLSFFYKDGPGSGNEMDPYNLDDFGIIGAKVGRLADGSIVENYIGGDGNNQNVLIVGREGTAGTVQLGDDKDLSEFFTIAQNRNPNFNEGHLKRINRCVTVLGADKQVELFIPLAYLFDFFDAHRFCFRGAQIKIKLFANTTSPAKYLLSDVNPTGGGGNDAHKFVLSKLKLWVPRLKPSPSREVSLLSRLDANPVQPLRWFEYFYKQSPIYVDNTTESEWLITTSITKPNKIYLFFQNELKQTDQRENNGVFDHFQITEIYVKINTNYNFPKDFLVCNFHSATQEDYMRAYLYLLESQNKMLNDENGLLISYEEYKTLYPIFVFDLSKIEERIFEATSPEITVKFKRDDVASIGDSYRCHAVIESLKEAYLKVMDRRMIFTRQ